MSRLVLIPILFLMACLFAGVYGAVHNQISYSVSPEYFTQFKFHQFRISDNYPARVGAAVVGWKAAWWMGIVIGVILIPLGVMVIRDTENCFRVMMRVFGIVAMTTLMVGFAALAFAFVTVDESAVRRIAPFGNQIQDDAAFVRAGTMHNFSYLGGLIGIVSGGFSLLRRRRSSGPTQVIAD